MSNLYHIYHNHQHWISVSTEYQLKPEYGGDTLVEVEYGYCDGDDGCGPTTMYLREPIYREVVIGNYHIHPDTFKLRSLRIADHNGNIIPPLKKDIIY